MALDHILQNVMGSMAHSLVLCILNSLVISLRQF